MSCELQRVCFHLHWEGFVWMACIMCHHMRFSLSFCCCPAEEDEEEGEEESTGMAHKAKSHCDVV